MAYCPNCQLIELVDHVRVVEYEFKQARKVWNRFLTFSDILAFSVDLPQKETIAIMDEFKNNEVVDAYNHIYNYIMQCLLHIHWKEVPDIKEYLGEDSYGYYGERIIGNTVEYNLHKALLYSGLITDFVEAILPDIRKFTNSTTGEV